MIAAPAGVKVLVATKPVDFRKGAEGLVALVQEQLRHDPFSGTIFHLPFEASGPLEDCGLGWIRAGAAVEAAGARSVSMAADQGYGDEGSRVGSNGSFRFAACEVRIA